MNAHAGERQGSPGQDQEQQPVERRHAGKRTRRSARKRGRGAATPDGGRARTAQGPGALMQLRGPGRCDVRSGRQFFLAGTAVGFGRLGGAGAGHAGRGGLGGRGLAGRRWSSWPACRSWPSAVTGLAPEFGASTAFSAVALVVSAASSTLFSALSATLVAWAAVFCATEVTLLEASDDLGRALLEHVLEGVLDGVDGALGAAHDPAEAGLVTQLLDDLGTVLGQLLDGGGRLGAGGLDQAGDGAAQRLGTDGDGELLGRGAGGAGGLGGPGAGLLDGEVGLDLRLARQGLGLGAELGDDGLGALDGQVTGADGGQDGVLAARRAGWARRSRRTASRSGWGSC